MLCSFPAVASEYRIDYDNSAVRFLGTHAGNEFRGVFEAWDGEIVFDTAYLDSSRIVIRFDLKSAKTGNGQYDGTLPTSDWFAVKKTPQGVFETTEISENEDGSYLAIGNLTLRDITKPVSFDFLLSDLSIQPVTAKGEVVLDRLDYDIGKKSDPKAEWVSREITVQFDITANVVE